MGTNFSSVSLRTRNLLSKKKKHPKMSRLCRSDYSGEASGDPLALYSSRKMLHINRNVSVIFKKPQLIFSNCLF